MFNLTPDLSWWHRCPDGPVWPTCKYFEGFKVFPHILNWFRVFTYFFRDSTDKFCPRWSKVAPTAWFCQDRASLREFIANRSGSSDQVSWDEGAVSAARLVASVSLNGYFQSRRSLKRFRFVECLSSNSFIHWTPACGCLQFLRLPFFRKSEVFLV